mmetsp:Transcript_3862/g.6050  ORF Transcript_3862/g.6050 Transcript_3862/m.6050 type:complete len:82 (-) Transcript_3862:1021-1266(-)
MSVRMDINLACSLHVEEEGMAAAVEMAVVEEGYSMAIGQGLISLSLLSPSTGSINSNRVTSAESPATPPPLNHCNPPLNNP